MNANRKRLAMQWAIGMALCCVCISPLWGQQQWELHRADADASVEFVASDLRAARLALCGNRFDGNGRWSVIVHVLGSTGDTLWSRQLPDSVDCRSHDLRLGTAGEVYVAGMRWQRGWRLFVQSWSADGVPGWQWVAPRSDGISQLPVAMITAADGTMLLCCNEEGDGTQAAAVFCLESDGDLRWSRRYENTHFACMLPRPEGTLLAGWERLPVTKNSLLMLLGPNAELLQEWKQDLAPGYDDGIVALAADERGVSAGVHVWSSDSTIRPLLLRLTPQWNSALFPLAATEGRHRIVAVELLPGGLSAVSLRSEGASGDMNAVVQVFRENGVLEASSTVDGDGAGSDLAPPHFTGVSGGYTGQPQSLTLAWPPAWDAVSAEEELRYELFVSALPGTIDYARPVAVLRSTHQYTLHGLTADTEFACAVRVRDIHGNSDGNVNTLLLRTPPEALRILTSTLPVAVVGAAYSVALQAVGGVPPYIWTVLEASLPSALQLSGDGHIVGTPDSSGLWLPRLLVTDARGDTATTKLVLRVDAEALHLFTKPLPDARVCAQYAVHFDAAGGTRPYRFDVVEGSPPPGMQLSIDGLLQGVPDEPGTSTFTVRVRDNAGQRDEAEFTLNVLPAARWRVTGDTTLAAGSYCFSTLEIPAGVTLRCAGPTDVLVSDTLLLQGSLWSPCAALRILHYRVLLLEGSVVDTCADGAISSGELLLFSAEGALLQNGSIISDVPVRCTDDSTITDAEALLPRHARSPLPLDPVCEVLPDRVYVPIPPGDTAVVWCSITGVDPDGGTVRFDVNDGSGTVLRNLVPADGVTLDVPLRYTSEGSRTITVTIIDDEGRSAVSSARIVVVEATEELPPGFGLATACSDVLYALSDSIALVSRFEGVDVDVASYRWETGDGRVLTEPNPVILYAAAGRYELTCAVTTATGQTASAEMSLYVYQPDSTRLRAMPATSALPATRAIASRQPQTAGGTAVVNGPLMVRERIVFHGFQHLRFDSAAVMTSRPPRQALPGAAGRSGNGLRTTVPDGWLVINNSTFRAASGAQGGTANAAHRVGGAGGKGGSLYFHARNILVMGGSFEAGDGGPGGDANVFVPAEGTAYAFGGRGSDAAAHVRFTASNSITFLGPVNIYTGNGGRGGNATATGGPGLNRCNNGQNGANALARGGAGGSARKNGVVRGNVTGTEHITLSGGQGGAGGNATANGGKGGDADNCTSTAVGGKGGWARAFGGDGGPSGHQGVRLAGAEQFKPGKGGNAVAAPGDGGNARAIPDPQKGRDGCPGENGGSSTAVGGRGGDGRAMSGKMGKLYGQGTSADPGDATVQGSDGGHAGANGGDGGNGTGCNCAGGNGGNAEARGGLRGDTDVKGQDGGAATSNPGSDGTASALGGNGGNGGHCCTPPAASGGDGGAGGNATVSSGSNGGSGNAIAGDGGDGGDGKGPGKGGPGGIATVSGPVGLKLDGNRGSDGVWCYIISTWYIYFSSIPDGPLLPGTDVTLGTYPAKIPANQSGLLTVHVMTQAETGFGSPPFVMKAGAELSMEQAGLRFQMATLQDIINPGTQWNTEKFSITLTCTHPLGGSAFIRGYNQGVLTSERELVFAPGQLTQNGGITAPQGAYFDRVDVVSPGPVSLNHWEVEIVVVDP